MNSFPQTITIAGIKHSGKSTLGRSLAAEKGFAFYDVDEVLSRQYNKSVRELFRSIGEDEFRKIEAQTAKELAEKNENKVISLGGGAVNDCFFALKLQDLLGRMIMVDISDETAEKRVFANGVPAYLEKYSDPKAALREINDSRRAKMREVCSVVYTACDTLSPEEQAVRFVNFLEQKDAL